MKALAKRYLALVLSVLMVVSLVGTVSFADPTSGEEPGQGSEQTSVASYTLAQPLIVGDTQTQTQIISNFQGLEKSNWVETSDATVLSYSGGSDIFEAKKAGTAVISLYDGNGIVQGDLYATINVTVENPTVPAYTLATPLTVGDTPTQTQIISNFEGLEKSNWVEIDDETVLERIPVGDKFEAKKAGTAVISLYSGNGVVRGDLYATITVTVVDPTAAVEATFLDKDGQQFGDKVQANDQGIVTPPTSTPTPPDNKEFDFWHLEGVETGYDWTQPIRQNTTFYPAWKDATTSYQVTFNTNGGTTTDPTTVQVNAGEKVAEADIPTVTKQCAELEGWYKSDGETETKVDFATETISANLDVTAHWTTKHNVEVSQWADNGDRTFKCLNDGCQYKENPVTLHVSAQSLIYWTGNTVDPQTSVSPDPETIDPDSVIAFTTGKPIYYSGNTKVGDGFTPPTDPGAYSVRYYAKPNDGVSAAKYAYADFEVIKPTVELAKTEFTKDGGESLINDPTILPEGTTATLEYKVDESGTASATATNTDISAGSHTLYYRAKKGDTTLDWVEVGNFEVKESTHHLEVTGGGTGWTITCSDTGCPYNTNPAEVTTSVDSYYYVNHANATVAKSNDPQGIVNLITTPTYYEDKGDGNTEKQPTEPGKYIAKFSFTVPGDNQTYIAYDNFTAVKATVAAAEGVAAGSSDELVTTTWAPDKTSQNVFAVQYQVEGKSDTWSETPPTAADLTEGTYNVKWQVVKSATRGSNEDEDPLDSGNVEVNVGPAQEHVHVWSVAGKNTDTATITCTGAGDCDYKTTGFTVSINAPTELEYDGNPKEATIQNGIPDPVKSLFSVQYNKTYGKIKYVDTDKGEPLTSAPVLPGHYTAYTKVLSKNSSEQEAWDETQLKVSFEITGTPHTHLFKIYNNAGVRTVKCEQTDDFNCPYKTTPVVIEVDAEDSYYLGKVETDITKTTDPDNVVHLNTTPEYYSGDTSQGSTCTDPGKINVRYTFTVDGVEYEGEPVENTAYKFFDVYKATVKATQETPFIYDSDTALVEESWVPSVPDDYTIKYWVDNKAYTSIPTAKGLAAGTHTVTWKAVDRQGAVVDGDDISIEIAKKQLTVTLPTGETGLTYTGSAQELIDTAGAVTDPSSGYEFRYALGESEDYSADATSIKGTESGSYTVNYKVYKKGSGETPDEECTTDNYTFVDSEGTPVSFTPLNVSIDRKELVVTLPTGKDDLTYNREDQVLVNDGTAPEGYVFKYAVGAVDIYDVANTATGKDADTYSVSYKVYKKGSGEDPDVECTTANYKFVLEPEGEEVTFSPLSVTIAQANPVKKAPEGLTLPYNGADQALAEAGELTEIAVADGMEMWYSLYPEENFGPSIPEATTGTHPVYWKVSPMTDPNYDFTDASGTVTGKIYDGTLTPPKAATDLKYEEGTDQKLLTKAAEPSEYLIEQGAKVLYGVSDADDKLPTEWTESIDDITGQDVDDYYVWYKAVSSDGETELVAPDYVSAMIMPVVAEFDREPQPYDDTYDGDDHALIRGRGQAPVTDDGVIYYSLDPSDEDSWSTERPRATDAGTYVVYYYIKGDENHFDSDVDSVTATISPLVVALRWYGENGSTTDFSYVYDGSEKCPTAQAGYWTGPNWNRQWHQYDGVAVTVEGAEKDAGSYTATATALTGTNADNYELPENATHNFTISKATLTIQWFEDEDATQPLTEDPKYGFDGSFHGPVARLYNGETAVSEEAVRPEVTGYEIEAGEYTAKVTGLSDEDNYELSNDAAKEQDYEITKKKVRIIKVDAQDRVYDGTDAAKIVVTNAEVVGKVNGYEDVTVESYDGTATFDGPNGKDVGNDKPVTFDPAKLVLTGDDKDNYVIDAEACLNKADATISKLEVEVVWYKDADHVAGDSVRYIYNGKKRAPIAKLDGVLPDDQGAVGVDIDTPDSIHAQKDAYKATANGLKKIGDTDTYKNYKLSGNSAKSYYIDPKPLDVEWYKDEGALDPSAETFFYWYNGQEQKPIAKAKRPTGATPSDDDGSIVEGDTVNVGTKVTDIDGQETVSIDSAYYCDYAISIDNSDYDLVDEPTDADHIIWPKDVTVSFAPVSFTYNGQHQAPAMTVEGLVDGDECTVTEWEITGDKAKDNQSIDAGDYNIRATDLSNDNYFMYQVNAKDYVIDPRKVKLAWSDTEFTYDGEKHIPAATVTNPVEGELLSVLAKTPQKDAGTYTATATDLGPSNVAKNYTIDAAEPTRETEFTINKAKVTVTASDQTIYTGDNFDKTKVSYKGFAEGEDASVLTTKPTVSSDYFKNAKAGTYKLTPAGAAADNYDFVYANGKLTVKKKVTWLVAKAQAKGATKAKLTWNKPTGAKSYDVYINKCNTKNNKYKPKYVATVKTNTYTKKGLKKGKCYKYYIVAKDAKGNKIAKSKTSHVAAGNIAGKLTNAKSVKVNKTDVSLAAGQKFAIKASQSRAIGGKTLLDGKHVALFRYTSTNKAVATVSKKGVITAKGAGYCEVYVQAANGLWKTVKVTVK